MIWSIVRIETTRPSTGSWEFQGPWENLAGTGVSHRKFLSWANSTLQPEGSGRKRLNFTRGWHLHLLLKILLDSAFQKASGEPSQSRVAEQTCEPAISTGRKYAGLKTAYKWHEGRSFRTDSGSHSLPYKRVWYLSWIRKGFRHVENNSRPTKSTRISVPQIPTC